MVWVGIDGWGQAPRAAAPAQGVEQGRTQHGKVRATA